MPCSGSRKGAPKGKRAKKNHNNAKSKLQAEKSKWARARQDKLLAGKVDTVLQEVRKLTARVARTGPGTRSRRRPTWRITENLTCSEVGHIVMGTGNVEGTIKQLGARMKGPGMRWSVERAERVLALRCLQL